MGIFQREDAGTLPEAAQDDGFHMQSRRPQTVRNNQTEDWTGEEKGAVSRG